MVKRGERSDLPIEVAKAFMCDVAFYFTEPDPIRKDEIAARQMEVLRQYRSSHEKKLKVSNIKRMFEDPRNQME